jgi:hypothetical protein
MWNKIMENGIMTQNPMVFAFHYFVPHYFVPFFSAVSAISAVNS